ncbi:hypothetical protein P12x_005880 [Tundrisphaera lichenicola]|uniref:hypothetical protein n=1 Tax=Tundrisphaera lichenicola TaxID=2029860 RepID=UPI003EBB3A54
MASELLDSKAPTEVDWRRIHAFGLPSGSVRALLAILVFGMAWALLVLRPTEEIPNYLRDLLFVIMGHYFASRRRVAPEVDPGPPPLYLPRGSVRLILVAGCLAVAAFLFRRGDLAQVRQNPAAVTLLMVGGFLLGVGLNAAITWWRDRGHRPHRAFEDLRALASMVAAIALAGLVANRLHPLIPPEQVDSLFSGWVHLGRFGPENLLAAVVGFYFGSRS